MSEPLENRIAALEKKIDFFEHVLSLQGGENDAYRAVIEGVLRHTSIVSEVRKTICELLEIATVSNLHESTNASYSGGFERVIERLQREMDFLIEPIGYKSQRDSKG